MTFSVRFPLARRTYSKPFCRVCVRIYMVRFATQRPTMHMHTVHIKHNMDKCSRSMDGCIVCIVYSVNRVVAGESLTMENIEESIDAYLLYSRHVLWIVRSNSSSGGEAYNFMIQCANTPVSATLTEKGKLPHWQKLSSEIFIKSDSGFYVQIRTLQRTADPSHANSIACHFQWIRWRRMECCIFTL